MGIARFRLLIVDDESEMLHLLILALEPDGYDILTARDGVDALSWLVDPLPSVIISDLRMPRMSGFEFLTIVRRQFPRVPVLAISSEFPGNELPAGVLADAYLQKGGYTMDQLRSTVTELIAAPPVRC